MFTSCTDKWRAASLAYQPASYESLSEVALTENINPRVFEAVFSRIYNKNDKRDIQREIATS